MSKYNGKSSKSLIEVKYDRYFLYMSDKAFMDIFSGIHFLILKMFSAVFSFVENRGFTVAQNFLLSLLITPPPPPPPLHFKKN